MDLQLEGKRALVTGSSSGIGEQIARSLADEGVTVVVHGRDIARTEAVASSIRETGGKAVAVTAGLLDQAEVESLAQRATDAVGVIDILVNNAGGRTVDEVTTWAKIDSSTWADCFHLNVIAPAVLISRLLPPMRDQNWGRFIQVSSAQAYHPRSDTTEYGASKSALNAVTVSLSKELEGTGITSNTVSPGAVATPALIAVMHARAKDMGWPEDPEELERAAVKSRWPSTLQRLGKTSEVAAAVLLLASPLGGFFTGANLRVDGGRTGVTL